MASTKKNNAKQEQVEKQSIITKIVLFFKGVKGEVKKVHWLSKKEMVKYSIATISFILFCAVFFYAIINIFAWVLKTFA